ncbi:8-oxo-dGTP diphosphatase [Actinocorallia herbida]|uniref:8-oxo-dGTP diphosphatase n=1 Tax=Actinocorallia herbida TaxID=58109 RepID=A0A3N1CT34_9ACTN|nr:NUDIX hydrolase [Actinocorallia herbida]ROO84469.1 8-oxo-dGTP diphosphatase [Actinocorallia herbida]
MAAPDGFPVLDPDTGDALTAFLPASGADPPADAPLPAALVAVWSGRHLLLVFDRYRARWELPGGGIEPGETPHRAALRELEEEAGLRLAALDLTGYARFRLTRPARTEYAALFSARVRGRPDGFTPSAEIGAIHWWDTAGPAPEGTQVLDAVLALRARGVKDPGPGQGSGSMRSSAQ